MQTHHLAEKCLTFSAAQSLHLIAVYLEKEIPLIMYMEVQCLTEATSALEEYFEFLPEACNEILNLSVQASVWVCSDSQKDNGVASQTWPASSTAEPNEAEEQLMLPAAGTIQQHQGSDVSKLAFMNLYILSNTGSEKRASL